MTLFELIERPDLEAPAMVLALDGWIDAGMAGTQAIATILDATETATVATFDADALLDHRARRPTLLLEEGVATDLTWPQIELRAAVDLDGRDVLLLVGAEPDHNWRAFSGSVADLALEFGCRMVTSIGAYPAAVPHTRATKLIATASSPDLLASIGYVHGRLEVPAGVHAAIERDAADAGLPAVGLWAQIPHYAAAMPYPEGALTLIEGLERCTSLRFGRDELREEARSTRERLDALVANSTEHMQLVNQLEAHVDTIDAVEREGIPSGDDIAAELERFLREQDG